MKRLFSLCFLLVIGNLGCRSAEDTLRHMDTHCPSPVLYASEEPTVPEITSGTVQEFVEIGLNQNPAIRAAQLEMDAILHQIPQQLSLPDPVVNTTTYLSPVQTAAGEQTFGLGMQQKYIHADRRAARASITLESVRAAEANLNKVKLETGEKIRNVCYQLLHIRKSLEITQQDFKLLGRIEEDALKQLEVKKSASQRDVLNVRVEQSNTENKLTLLRQQEKNQQARLARLLHLPIATKFQIVSVDFQFVDLKQQQSLVQKAMELRPELKSQLANIRMQQKARCLAELQKKPDFTFGVNWIATSENGISPVANGDDALLFGVSFNLPVRKQRIASAIDEASTKQRGATAKYDSLKDEIAEEVYQQVVRINSLQQTLQLLQEDILRNATRTMELSRAEYQEGKAPLFQLLQDWRTQLKYRILESQLKSEYHQAISGLARRVGEMGIPGKAKPQQQRDDFKVVDPNGS